ncbi:MAG: hypothetical protein ACJAYF_003039 [Arenicella sp.]|jgi:hypothetical protein
MRVRIGGYDDKKTPPHETKNKLYVNPALLDSISRALSECGYRESFV